MTSTSAGRRSSRSRDTPTGSGRSSARLNLEETEKKSADGRWKVVGPTSLNRASFRRQIRRVPLERLAFLDESWLSVAMSRSHAWVQHLMRKTHGYPYILE